MVFSHKKFDTLIKKSESKNISHMNHMVLKDLSAGKKMPATLLKHSFLVYVHWSFHITLV